MSGLICRITIISCLLGSASAEALAAPATAEGAEKIRTALQQYYGTQTNLLSVTPDGDDYLLKFDAAVLLNKSLGEATKAEISPFIYKIADLGGGKWSVNQDQAFDFKIDAPQGTVRFKTGQMKMTGMFDESLKAFSKSTTDISDLSMEQNITVAGQPPHHVSYNVKSYHIESTATASATGGADVMMAYALDKMDEQIVSQVYPGIPYNIAITFDTGKGSYKLANFRNKEILEAIAFWVANPEASMLRAKQDKVRDLAKRLLPIFDNFNGGANIDRLRIKSGFGDFYADTAHVSVDMNGIVAKGKISETVSLEGIALPSGLVPAYVSALIPKSFTMNIGAADFNLDAPARLLIEQTDAEKGPPQTPEFKQFLLTALLPQGTVTLTSNANVIKADAFELAADGRLAIGPATNPNGNSVVKIKGLDKVIELLQAAPAQAQLQQAVAALIFVKGLGKTETDGSLSWKVDSTPDGSATVNGVDVRKLGGPSNTP